MPCPVPFYEHTDTVWPDAPEDCAVDSSIVGGTQRHSKRMWEQHVTYKDNPGRCWVGLVCDAHLGRSLAFVVGETALSPSAIRSVYIIDRADRTQELTIWEDPF